MSIIGQTKETVQIPPTLGKRLPEKVDLVFWDFDILLLT